MSSTARSFYRGAAAITCGATFVFASVTSAQVVDSSKTPPVPVTKPDSAKVTLPVIRPARTPVRSATISGIRQPPITPKRAFLYSLAVPGLGQSRLDRGTAGALFAAIELGSIAMVGKTTIDLKQARRYSVDSTATNYTIAADGKITAATGFSPQFSVDIVNARRLHREDWFAAILFNHLISGLDAFVAAQLWDVSAPAAVSFKPHNDGVALVATLRW